MQIIKPAKLSLISKAYGFHGHQFAVGAMSFFKLGATEHLLTENSQWPKISSYLNRGLILDMGFAKANGEMLLAGNAYAPDNKPVTQMKVSAKLGGIKKQLKVIGERHWNGSFFSPASLAKPFLSMPLSYRQTYGGQEYGQNPLGKGLIQSGQLDKDSGLYDLANVYYCRQSHAVDREERQVACFEPMDITWPQRAKYQGTYDQKWLKTTHPGFPDNTKPKLFNAAPLDQQIKNFFQPGDSYEIKGMHKKEQCIQGRLPNIVVRAFISQRVDGEELFKAIQTQIDTVWFFPEQMLGVAIHRGIINVGDSDALDVKKIVLACERHKDEPRAKDYYEKIMKLRLDPKTAVAHLLNESQLMPVKTRAQEAEEKALYAEAKEQQDKDNRAFAKRHLNQLSKEDKNLSVLPCEPTVPDDPDEQPPPIPQALIESGDIDLAPYVEYAENIGEKAKIERQLTLDNLKRESKSYQGMKADEVESVADMQARIQKVVYITAAPDKSVVQKPLKLKPKNDWMNLISHDDQMTTELERNIDKANAKLLNAERQSRQSSPTVTVLVKPLPEKGALLLRDWAIELLNTSKSLAGRDFAGANFSGMDFSGLDLRDVMLERANLTSCIFHQCQLDGAVMTGATLDGASFHESSLVKANLAECNGKKVGFNHTNLKEASFIRAKLCQSDFSDANLMSVQVVEANFYQSRLQRVQCEKAHFIEAKLAHTDWQQANIQSCTFLQCDLQKSNWHKVKMQRCLMIECDAEESQFSEIKAKKVQFSNQGKFHQANLSHGLWESCGFRGLNLTDSDMRGAIFKACDFGETQLNNANLTTALFDHSVMALADFSGSDCRKTFFNQSSLRKCVFKFVDLRNCEINQTDLTEVRFYRCKKKGFLTSPQTVN